jgi:hypothetical protein
MDLMQVQVQQEFLQVEVEEQLLLFQEIMVEREEQVVVEEADQELILEL